MIYWIIFILACYGCTAILIWGRIFNFIRPKYYFFHCAQCTGFYVGILFFLLFWLSGIKLFSNLYSGSFIAACISSGTSYILCSIFGDDGMNINYKDKE